MKEGKCKACKKLRVLEHIRFSLCKSCNKARRRYEEDTLPKILDRLSKNLELSFRKQAKYLPHR